MKVFYYENIFNETYKELNFRKGSKIGTIVKSLKYPKADYMFIINDEVFYYPKDKNKKVDAEFITIKLIPGKKSGLLNGLMVVVGAVLCCTGVGSAVGVGLIAAGVSGFIAQIMTPKTSNVPALTDNSSYDIGQTQNKYGVSGTSNQSNLGSTYPVVFGKSIMTPPYVGNYYTTLSDNSGNGEQYLTILLNLGYAPLKVSNIKVGDNLVCTNKEDVRNGLMTIDGEYPATIDIRQDGNLPDIYNTKYYQEQIGSEIKYIGNHDKDIRTTPKKTKKVRFDIKFNSLYHQNEQTGKLEIARVGFEFAYRKTGTEDWNIVNSTLTIDVYETYIRYSPFTKIKVYPQTVQGNEFTLSTSAGNFIGRYYNGKAQIYILSTWFDVNSSATSGITYSGNENKNKRYYVELNFTDEDLANNPDMQWDIAVWRTTPDRGSYYQDKGYLESILYTIDDIPVLEEERKKLCLVAFRIQANEFMQNVINKVNMEVQSVLPVWNSENWETEEATSNPASCYLQAIRGNYLKKQATDNQIDWDGFARLYEFCENKGYYCNGIISSPETLKDIITKILNTCRSEFSIKNGMYSVVIDDVRPTPIAIISPKNSSGFQFTKDLGEKVNALKITYQNKDDDYKTTEEEVRLFGEVAKPDDNIISSSLWGVNNHEQAFKIARYTLASSRLRPETYTCKVSVEHFALPRGARVELQHDVLMIGLKSGYIRKIEGNKITLDELLPIQEEGKQYGLKIIPQVGDEIKVINVNSFNDSVYTVETEDDLTDINEGDFYAYGEVGKITEDCIIVNKSIEESPSLCATLTLKAYAPEIFEAEEKPIPEYDSKITSAVKFSTDFVYDGAVEELDVENNGSTVQDDGAIWLNVKSPYIINDKLINLGDLYTIGKADNTCEIAGYDNRSWVKGGNGYVRFKVDNAMYESYTISLILKAEPSVEKKTIAHYYQFIDRTDLSIFEVFTEENKLYVNVKNIIYEVPDWDFSDKHNLVVVYSKEYSTVYIYVDGLMKFQFFTNNITGNILSEDGDMLLTENDDYIILEPYNAKNTVNDRDKYFYLLQDSDGSNKSNSLIAEFRIWKFAMRSTEVKSFYLNNYFLHDTLAETRYLGEFEVIPPETNFYDWFYYTGENNINFLHNHYYRKNRDSWQLYEIYVAKIDKNGNI